MPDDILNQPAAPAAPATPAAPAAPAPAAPATPPATPPAAPAEPAATVDTATGVITYEPTGDIALDLSLEFFGKLGLGFDSPELQEAGKGNFKYLEAKLAEMGDKAKGFEKFVELAREAHGRLKANEQTAYEQRKATVYEAVGGEENWKKIQEHVKANATPEELNEVKEAIAQGGIVARAVATLLHNQYFKTPGVTVDPADPTTRQSTPPAGGNVLTKAGYLQELNVLVARYGSHRLDGTQEYADLRRKYANVKQ